MKYQNITVNFSVDTLGLEDSLNQYLLVYLISKAGKSYENAYYAVKKTKQFRRKEGKTIDMLASACALLLLNQPVVIISATFQQKQEFDALINSFLSEYNITTYQNQLKVYSYQKSRNFEIDILALERLGYQILCDHFVFEQIMSFGEYLNILYNTDRLSNLGEPKPITFWHTKRMI